MEYRKMIVEGVKREVFNEFCEKCEEDAELRGNIITKYDGTNYKGKLTMYSTRFEDAVSNKALELFCELCKKYHKY